MIFINQLNCLVRLVELFSEVCLAVEYFSEVIAIIN